MFIRVFRERERRELLLNVNFVSLIEVMYAIHTPSGVAYRTGLKDGLENPAAVRLYKMHVGGEEFLFAGDPDDPVVKVFEEIYKNAIKGRARPPAAEGDPE